MQEPGDVPAGFAEAPGAAARVCKALQGPRCSRRVQARVIWAVLTTAELPSPEASERIIRAAAFGYLWSWPGGLGYDTPSSCLMNLVAG